MHFIIPSQYLSPLTPCPEATDKLTYINLSSEYIPIKTKYFLGINIHSAVWH